MINNATFNLDQCKLAFSQAIHEAGINCKAELLPDGQIHRFSTGYKDKDQDGWYVFYGMAGAFGDWKQDIQGKWRQKEENKSQEERLVLAEQRRKAQIAADNERQRSYEETAQKMWLRWSELQTEGSSSYLERKKIDAFGIRFNGSVIYVPLQDMERRLWSIQSITEDGTKRFFPGGRKQGCFHHIGVLEDGKPIYIVEGYATGASIHKATQHTVVIAFDAGNLDSIIAELKKFHPHSPFVIAGDDDVWSEKNVGREKAERAAAKYDCSVVFPVFKSTTSKPTDFNELHVLEGLEEVKRQLAMTEQHTALKAMNVTELLSLDIPPRGMLLSPLLPEQGLAMIHAPRGIGKTHVSLMIAYAVSMGSAVFDGKWMAMKPYKVLFVDGELPLSVMQERLLKLTVNTEGGVCANNNLSIITPDLQEHGIPDLTTPQGQKIIEEHLKNVKLLILDNHSSLCRQGRENDSESWVPLQGWFLSLRRRGISVLLIHHSNKSGTQRGTSRKEDLLDTIITLRKPQDYDPREGARFEVHYEKARSFYGKDAAPFEASLKEKDGKFLWQVQNIEDTQIDRILELNKEGLTQRDIAKETGLSPATINRRLKEAKEKELLG